MESTPVTLLQRLRRPDDAAAWSQFVHLYTPLLYGWARRAGLSEVDAADLLQDVFTTLVQELPRFEYQSGRSFRAWMRTILLNRWRTLQRRRAPQPVPPAELDGAAESDPDLPGEAEERRELVRRGLALIEGEFTPATWQAFRQFVVRERRAAEVAAELFAYHAAGDRRGGRRSPLVLNGLVLSGANRQGEAAAPDRGILTGEGIVGLPLENLQLAVLSACETGLGDDGGGEGVYGLQRAFHIAGCKNVIASLWKVDDSATQALMVLFYRNLWEKKLDAAEALRQAQLTLYRRPEAVAVAIKRGVDFTESDLPMVEEKPAEKPKRSPTAHWAAFTFSGVRPADAKSAK